jgi:hypothetical protein
LRKQQILGSDRGKVTLTGRRIQRWYYLQVSSVLFLGPLHHADVAPALFSVEGQIVSGLKYLQVVLFVESYVDFEI